MFGFLKKKLKNAVSSFTKKVDEEGEKEEIIEEKKEEQVAPEEKPKKAVAKKKSQETQSTSTDDSEEDETSETDEESSSVITKDSRSLKTKTPSKTKSPKKDISKDNTSKEDSDEPAIIEKKVPREETPSLDEDQDLEEKTDVDSKKDDQNISEKVFADEAIERDIEQEEKEIKELESEIASETDEEVSKEKHKQDDPSQEEADPKLVTDERVSVETDEVVLDTSIDEEKPEPKRGFFGRIKDRWTGKTQTEETEIPIDEELQEKETLEETKIETQEKTTEDVPKKKEEKHDSSEEAHKEDAHDAGTKDVPAVKSDSKKDGSEVVDTKKEEISDEKTSEEDSSDEDDVDDKEDSKKEDTEIEHATEEDITKGDSTEKETDEQPDSVIEKTLSEEKEKLEKEYEEKQPVTETTEEEPEEPKGFFGRLRQSISSRKISESQFEDMFWEIEMALLENSVAVEVIEKIKNDLHKSIVGKPIPRSEVEGIVLKRMGESLQDLFNQPSIKLIEAIETKKKENKPYVICFVGVNGSGKTTTIAKVVHMLKQKGYESVISASDTFRAAAIDQLQIHADNLGVKLIKHDYNSDPAAVAFDAIKHAEAKKKHVVLIDTAGRLHSNANLMEELHKIIKVAKPDLTVFLGEAITGNDCIEQAREFNEMVPIDGIILSKADIDQKGGAAISISYVLGKPIMFLGVGQNYEDLREFTPEFVLKELEI